MPSTEMELMIAMTVASTQAVVSKAVRFRPWRRRVLQHISGDALMLLGLAGVAFSLARVPLAQQALEQAPLAAPALGGLLLLGSLALTLPRPGARIV